MSERIDDRPISADALLKSTSDLWIHQNTIMWSRIQTLAILQAGFLGIGFALRALHYWALGVTACAFVMVLSVFLWHITIVDRRNRDIYATRLADMGFELAHQPLYMFRHSGATVYITMAFLALVATDIAAAGVILAEWPN